MPGSLNPCIARMALYLPREILKTAFLVRIQKRAVGSSLLWHRKIQCDWKCMDWKFYFAYSKFVNAIAFEIYKFGNHYIIEVLCYLMWKLCFLQKDNRFLKNYCICCKKLFRGIKKKLFAKTLHFNKKVLFTNKCSHAKLRKYETKLF
jgi:hypothetical protein